jgi:GNAT superfamily N-acetyltransferase
MRTTRRAAARDAAACKAIAESVPDHFTPDVPDRVVADLGAHGGYVLDDDGGVVAFVVVARRGASAAELLWIAVRRDLHRRGLGSRLLTDVLGVLADDGVAVVEAKTLDASANYAPYVATRAFWATHGFVQVDTINALPGWSPGSPAAILVAALRPTVAR